jgi:outer membrane protein assembly factor BamA
MQLKNIRNLNYLWQRVALLFCIFFLIQGSNLRAQKNAELFYKAIDANDVVLRKCAVSSAKESDTMALQNSVIQTVKNLKNKGYLSASIDSLVARDSNYYAYIFVGKVYTSFILENGNIDETYLSGIKLLSDKISWNEVELIKEKILKNAENVGYPFAAIYLDSIVFSEQKVTAKIYIEKNDKITIDSILINGKARIKNRFLSSYLHLKPGSLYSEEAILKMKKAISDLGFVEEERPHVVSFYNNKATINLFLKNRRTSKFDFIIGFLPNNDKSKKLLITGQARINIVNPFGTGGDLLIDWQKMQPKTQRLQLALSYPYFLNLPIGLDFKFDLYKRDTSNLDLNYRVGILYNFSGNSQLKAFVDVHSTRLLNVDSNAIKYLRKLPRILDTKNTLYGIEYRFDNLNYKFNPVRGNDLTFSFGAGLKKIEKNTAITRLIDPISKESFAYLYDSIPKKYLQFQFGIDYAKYWPIKRRSTIKTSIQAKYFVTKNIYENEMFRIGGNRLLRGFDEESIFTPYYTILSTEYRYLLSKNAYFYTFFDLAAVEDVRYRGVKTDFPFGFGLGVTLETKIGLFGLTYALGKQLDNKIEIKNSKIHFGYVNYF